MKNSFVVCLFSTAWLLGASSVASACSDAGPPNHCNDGGAAWISCSAHGDCPTGQLCGSQGYCQCNECAYGETCEGAACRCAAQERPVPGPGCTVETDSCGGYHVRCPPPDPGPLLCTTDGATPRQCTTNADCASAPHAGEGSLVCTSRGVCDCAPASVGCSVGARTAAPSAWLAVLAALGVLWRRRRAR